MLTSQNNDPRWILATIVESGNRRFWGWHKLCFATCFLLLFFLRSWNQNFFSRFRTGNFSSAAPNYEIYWYPDDLICPVSHLTHLHLSKYQSDIMNRPTTTT